jgi:SAM-dependent methyltransferase
MGSEHWGRRPRDWAELAEPSNERLFAEVLAEVLAALRAAAPVTLLDIGCGSGYAARMTATLGATVTGIDITPELLAIARERVPAALFVEGGMDRLPFPDAGFDAAVGFNAFPFADDPATAVTEAARVVRAGGLVAATTFAEPERNESTALHLALEPLRPSQAGAGRHLPYALSSPGGLERLLAGAGLEPVAGGVDRSRPAVHGG